YDGRSNDQFWSHYDNFPDAWHGKYVYDVDVDPFDSKRIIVTTTDVPAKDISGGEGVFLTIDGGVHWRQVNDGLPLLRVGSVAFNPHVRNQVVIGTQGRGFFQ
ncbi:MAG: hypothetical protein K0R75_3038, partial [Paenibacillaceae bacterium]|nr:hypothetical protein [Paenibacillaceae bacterium]